MLLNMLEFSIIFNLVLLTCCAIGTYGYPITASWFRDRFSKSEWDQTLSHFQTFGGDTVWLRGTPLIRRTPDELGRDPDFVWCGSQSSLLQRVLSQPYKHLRSIHIPYILKEKLGYEENFGQDLIRCPQYDRRLNSSRIYYIVVLPATQQRTKCDLPVGTEVYVVLTSFSGTDPHALLLESALEKNINVYFGLPSFPVSNEGFDFTLTHVYIEWVDRILDEHKHRYPTNSIRGTTLYDTIKGYYSTDEVCLAQAITAYNGFYLNLYKSLGNLVHDVKKDFTISPFIDLVRSELNSTITKHVEGFIAIAKLLSVDVIAVQEGRGAGKGCYYWDTQIDLPVNSIDPMLFDVLEYRQPSLSSDVTYRQAFSASNQLLFKAFGKAHDELKKEGIAFEFWLNVEAFEYLRTDPCLPVDTAGSGMAELLDRTSRERLDRAITVGGATVQKIISFAWDSDYICTNNQYNQSLADSVISDNKRPIISNCSFHSRYNLSVVVLGYNLDGETQSYTIHWTDTSGRARKDVLYGYFFIMDYGSRNDRVTSLQYVMLWDTYEWQALAPKGNVTVQAHGAYNDCIFLYDYS